MECHFINFNIRFDEEFEKWPTIFDQGCHSDLRGSIIMTCNYCTHLSLTFFSVAHIA